MFNKNKNILLIISIVSIVLLCFTAYGEILGYYFTSIDAYPLILTGKIDSFNDILKIFSSPLGGGFPFGKYYRPVSELSYGIDYIMWGGKPMGYHLTNMLLHLANSFIIFFVAYYLFRERRKRLLFAWGASVLLLLSPVSVALVPSISRRQDMLAAFFLLLSLISFSRFGESVKHGARWFIISFIFGALAIFSKESAFVLPLLIFFLSFLFDVKGDYAERAVRAIKHSIPFAGLVILNTLLHVLFFGQWGVKVPPGLSQHAAAAANSFFYLAAPLELLYLNIYYKIAIFLIVVVVCFASFTVFLFRLGIRGCLDMLTSREWRDCTYLVMFVLTYMTIFTVSGKSLDFYHYLPNMALTLLTVMAIAGKFKQRSVSVVIKSIAMCLVLYTIIYSPVLTRYTAWKDSSEITKQTIKETKQIIVSNRDISRIYLINWPGFIGPLNSGLPGNRSTILVRYSMNSWLEWSGLDPDGTTEFIVVSCMYFSAGKLNATFAYTVSDKEIIADVQGGYISLPRYYSANSIPFKFSIDDNRKKAKLEYVQPLKDNEKIFLYDMKGIRVVSNDLITKADKESLAF